ncbi:MAG: FAD:protein FMN transferase [Firmicutes bacterium]|nr:FAD:protein FMN transferase [Bacillota bacterium]
MKKLSLWAGLLLCLSLLLTACNAEESKTAGSSEMLLDTVCSVTLFQPADQELADQALELVEKYEALFSPTIPGSDIWNINQAQGESVAISPETAQMLELALEYGEGSDGRFDISIGQLSTLWDFGGANHLPSAEELEKALSTVDYRQLELSGSPEEGFHARLKNPESRLEPGGIAKGYIADRVADFLRENGVKAAIIDLGGNIVTLGRKSSGQPWRIGIETPFSERTEVIGTLSIGEASIVTSGIYERQFTRDGKLYHHILDPETGFPAENELLSVSIISRSSAQGDGLSTLAFLLGREEGSRFLEEQEGVLGAIWVEKSGEIYVQGEIDFREIQK